MKGSLLALPFVLLIFILPFPHTIGVRLTCLAAAFACALFLWRRFDPPAIPAKLPIALWAALAAASVAYSFDPAYSLSEVKNEVGYALMAYVAFLAFARGEKELRLLLAALGAATAVISAWGLAGTLQTGLWNESAGHGGAGAVSAFFCVSVPLLSLALAATRVRRERQLLAGAVALSLLAGFATRQRILWPVWLFQLALAAILLSRAGLSRWPLRRTLMVLAAAGVIGGAGLAGTQLWRAETGQIRAVDSRQAAWPAVVSKVLENPWQGAGFGRQAMRKGYPELFSEQDVLFWHAHNMFLNAAVAMGLPGAVALALVMGWFALAYASMLRLPDPRTQWLGVAGLLLLAGVVGRNLTNDFFVRDGSLLFWALNGALLGAGGRLAAAAQRHSSAA